MVQAERADSYIYIFICVRVHEDADFGHRLIAQVVQSLSQLVKHIYSCNLLLYLLSVLKWRRRGVRLLTANGEFARSLTLVSAESKLKSPIFFLLQWQKHVCSQPEINIHISTNFRVKFTGNKQEKLFFLPVLSVKNQALLHPLKAQIMKTTVPLLIMGWTGVFDHTWRFHHGSSREEFFSFTSGPRVSQCLVKCL